DLHLELLKLYGDRTWEAELAGPGQTYQVVEFNKDSFNGVHSVAVEQGNPAARSPSFQLSMAQMVMQAPGSTLRVADLVSFLVTGAYDALLNDANEEELAMEEENEALRRGEEVRVLICDRHWVHVPKHMAKLSSPEVRKDPKALQAGLAHLQDHFDKDR